MRYDTTKVDVAIPLIRHAVDTVVAGSIWQPYMFEQDWTQRDINSGVDLYIKVHTVRFPTEFINAVNVWEMARVFICELQTPNTFLYLIKDETGVTVNIAKFAKDENEFNNMSDLLEKCKV